MREELCETDVRIDTYASSRTLTWYFEVVFISERYHTQPFWSCSPKCI